MSTFEIQRSTTAKKLPPGEASPELIESFDTAVPERDRVNERLIRGDDGSFAGCSLMDDLDRRLFASFVSSSSTIACFGIIKEAGRAFDRAYKGLETACPLFEARGKSGDDPSLVASATTKE